MTTKAHARSVLHLAWPAMVENVLQFIVGFVDTLFVAKIGLQAVAGVGVANSVFQVYVAVFTALGVSAAALTAQRTGAGDAAGAARLARISLLLSALVGVLAGIVTGLLAPWILRLMGAADEVHRLGGTYLYIVGGFSILMSVSTVAGSLLRGAGDTKTPMKAAAIVNLIDIPLNYLLIFGVGAIPGLGVAGAAWSTVLARLCAVIILLHRLRMMSGYRSSRMEKVHAGWEEIRRIIALAIPAGIERLVMRLGQLLYFSLILGLGTATYAAHQIAGTIEAFSYMPGYGYAAAATTLVGQSIGRLNRDEGYRLGITASVLGMVTMSALGVCFFVLARPLAGLFTDDETVINLVVTALRIIAFGQPVLAASLILTGALQGAGDTKTPMYSTAVGIWGVRVAGVYILGHLMGLGLAGVWLSIVADLTIRTGILYWRFRRLRLAGSGAPSGQ